MNKHPSHLYGESIFTTTRTLDGKIVFRSQHVKRLLEQVNEYYFFSKLNLSELSTYFDIEQKFDQFAEGNPSSILRATIYSKPRETLVPREFKLSDLALSINSRELNISNPVSLMIMQSPFSEFKSAIKAGSYFQHFHSKRIAMNSGFDDALFIRGETLTEASTSNIIFEQDGVLYTPEDGSLFYGIGLEILQSSGFKLERRKISKRDFSSFSECYIVNSVHFLTPVKKIDDHLFTNSSLKFKLDKIDSFLRS